MVSGSATASATDSEIVSQDSSVHVVRRQVGLKPVKHRRPRRDQSAKDSFALPTHTPVDSGTAALSDIGLPKHKYLPVVSASRPLQKAEAPNRWSKALGSISQSSPASVAAPVQPTAAVMAPGAPAPGRQALRATQQQQAPAAKAAQPQQVQKLANKASATATSQEKEQAAPSALGNAAVRIVPRNSNSPSNPARRTSSGGGSTGGSIALGKQAQPSARDSVPAGQHQQSRNWAGIVSQRPQGQQPKQHQAQQLQQAAAATQPAAAKEPFPPLPGDGAHKEPAASPTRAWPAPLPPAADNAIGSKVAHEQPAGVAPAALAAPPTAATAAAPAKPAISGNTLAATKQKSASAAADTSNKEAGGQEQGSKPSPHWVPKQQQQQQQPQPQRVGSGDSLTSRETQSPAKNRTGRGTAGGAGRSASHLRPQESSSAVAAMFGHSSTKLPEKAVPISTAPVGLPPTPSNLLTTKAASAAAATAVAAGVAAAAAAQQAQHKAVNLPSSQEVNTAAMSDYASNRTTASSSATSYRVPAAAAAPAPPPALGGYDAFGAGFGPSHLEDTYGADNFRVSETGFQGAGYSSHVPAAAAVPSALPAPPAAPAPADTPVSAAAAAAPVDVVLEPRSSNMGGVELGGTSPAAYHPPLAGDQDHSKVHDYSSSSSNAALPTSSSSTSSTTSLPATGLSRARGLSADAPAFQFKAPTLVPTQVHAAQLEQQLFATAQGPETSKAAAKPTAATTSGSSGAAAPAAVNDSLSAKLRQLADRVEQEATAHDKAASESAEKVRQLQQQVDAAKAGQAAAEAQALGLNNELEAERIKVKDLESQLATQSSYAVSHAERADALAAELAAAAQIRDATQLEASRHIQVLQQQVHDQQVALGDLENKLRQWQDKYNSTEADNRGLRDMLGPRAPAPGTMMPATPTAAAGSEAFEVAAPPAAAVAPASQHRPAVKAPPPGFGPAPSSAAPAPAAPTASAAAEARHMKNEHELVSTLLSMLHASSHAAISWGDDETAGLDVQLLPLNWTTHYSARYGTVVSFMQQRPAVFAQRQDGAFYKVPGAEEMVKKAIADEEERAREAARAAAAVEQAAAQQAAAEAQARGAAAAPWRVPQFGADLGSNGTASGPSSIEGWNTHQQQHVGMPSNNPFPPSGLGVAMSIPFMAHPHHLMVAPGVAPMSMPMAAPSVPMGHGMHHQAHHSGHSGW